jgi:molybdate transport system permease protein
MSLTVDIQKHLPNYTLKAAFTVDPQTALGILGASGSGKSMTLRCIAGVETPDRGRIVLNGRVLFDSDRGINLPSRDRRVGIVFQTYALFPHLSVAENIGFGLRQLPKVDRLQRVGNWLAAMQLQGLGDRYPAQLSGGQQQRVALAIFLQPVIWAAIALPGCSNTWWRVPAATACPAAITIIWGHTRNTSSRLWVTNSVTPL